MTCVAKRVAALFTGRRGLMVGFVLVTLLYLGSLRGVFDAGRLLPGGMEAVVWAMAAAVTLLYLVALAFTIRLGKSM
ncbi:hypothetical protein [Pyrodictium occultum]|uniref:hypothetical protein n=1 Tax=Pyrodictium occultum TaxID=2309 RepID=UPI00071E9B1B|nr:hypothetical protein [Pyrodictium occultum]